MKHKIILASTTGASLRGLLKELKPLLAKNSSKILSSLILDEVFGYAVLAGGRITNPREIDDLVSKIEFELNMTREGSHMGYQYEAANHIKSLTKLRSASTVSDLMILGNQKEFDADLVRQLMGNMHCPMLILPRDVEVDCLLVAHDASQSSVRMVKHFLSLFSKEFRKRPLSALMTEPLSEEEIQNEKVFINYMKLFFPDIGVQVMYEGFEQGLMQFVTHAGAHPFLMVNWSICSDNLLHQFQRMEHDIPIFIYQD